MSARVKSVSRKSLKRLPSIAFVGGGALATSLARSLDAHGYSIREFVLRNPLKPRSEVKTLARKIGARMASFDKCALDADVVWIAVPDDAIESVANRIASGRKFAGKIVLHSSGARSSEVLESLKNSGASTASLHPMMSFSSANRNPDLRGVWFAAEGDSRALRFAKEIVTSLGGKVLAVEAEQKALYHAFGAMIAPLLVSHLEAAQQMAARAGLTAKTARAAMKPIVEKVVAAFLAGGADRAFSGPFLRGDVKTVERHLDSLRGKDEESIYRELAEYAIDHIKVENREELRKLLAKR